MGTTLHKLCDSHEKTEAESNSWCKKRHRHKAHRKRKKEEANTLQEQQYNLHSNVKSQAATMLLQSKGNERGLVCWVTLGLRLSAILRYGGVNSPLFMPLLHAPSLHSL
ncbi:hypothetical protein VNO80_08324 [Phaseolus coccineus]|uniref:Uncharacterized protein n=1 Tax=Phaseolus coccineus TaxID=3886 RepID=A0AAN9NKW4_PHACN